VTEADILPGELVKLVEAQEAAHIELLLQQTSDRRRSTRNLSELKKLKTPLLDFGLYTLHNLIVVLIGTHSLLQYTHLARSVLLRLPF